MNFNRLTVLLAATAHFIKKLTQNPFGIEIHTRRRELRSRKLSDLAWYGYTYKFCLYSFWNHRYLATASEFCEKKATTTTQQNKSSKIANTFRLMLLKPSTKSRCNDWRITSFVVIYSTGAESHDFDNVNRWIESLVRRTRQHNVRWVNCPIVDGLSFVHSSSYISFLIPFYLHSIVLFCAENKFKWYRLFMMNLFFAFVLLFWAQTHTHTDTWVQHSGLTAYACSMRARSLHKIHITIQQAKRFANDGRWKEKKKKKTQKML